ncbi:MAG: MBL fold metallo-hydrolase [Pseudomonadota bacterium]
MQIASLGSGSRGNATLVRSADTCVLVDCGFSFKEVLRRMRRLAFEPKQIDALLITHEHSDHCRGVETLAKTLRIPVYMSFGSAQADSLRGLRGQETTAPGPESAHATVSDRSPRVTDLRLFNAGEAFAVGDLQIQSIPVPHDAREPVQYRIDSRGARVGLLTDIGCVTSYVQEAYQDCRALLLEFNHDYDLLQHGPYPGKLKRRIASRLGHLSNDDAAAFLARIDTSALTSLIFAHASEENNSERCARQALANYVPQLQERAVWASQSEGTPWIAVASKPQG